MATLLKSEKQEISVRLETIRETLDYLNGIASRNGNPEDETVYAEIDFSNLLDLIGSISDVFDTLESLYYGDKYVQILRNRLRGLDTSIESDESE